MALPCPLLSINAALILLCDRVVMGDEGIWSPGTQVGW